MLKMFDIRRIRMRVLKVFLSVPKKAHALEPMMAFSLGCLSEKMGMQ